MAKDDWITTAEAARISGYNQEYIRRLVRAGKVDARHFGPLWQINRNSLSAYLRESKKSEDHRRGPRDLTAT